MQLKPMPQSELVIYALGFLKSNLDVWDVAKVLGLPLQEGDPEVSDADFETAEEQIQQAIDNLQPAQ